MIHISSVLIHNNNVFNTFSSVLIHKSCVLIRIISVLIHIRSVLIHLLYIYIYRFIFLVVSLSLSLSLSLSRISLLPDLPPPPASETKYPNALTSQPSWLHQHYLRGRQGGIVHKDMEAKKNYYFRVYFFSQIAWVSKGKINWTFYTHIYTNKGIFIFI